MARPPVVFGEQGQLRSGYFPGLFGVTRGVGRLATAALALRVVNFDTFAFDQVDGVHPGFGEEQIDHAGAEQVNLARFLRGVLAGYRQGRGDTGRIRHGVVKKLAHQASPGGPGYVSTEVDRVVNY